MIGGALIGAPGIFLIVSMPALQNTKGRMVGYKDHKQYGDSSIYNSRYQAKYYLNFPVIYTLDYLTNMPNPDALWQDMQKLDDVKSYCGILTMSYNSL